jgi:hypothetical protein
MEDFQARKEIHSEETLPGDWMKPIMQATKGEDLMG